MWIKLLKELLTESETIMATMQNLDTKKLAKRVTARKYQGDDLYSWAVFIDGAPYITGLGRNEVPGYKRQAIALLMKREV